MRWQHPVRGLLGPSEFIEFAEDSGLIEAIGSWVLKAACEQHRQREAAGIAIPRVAVNVSNRQLGQADFLADIDLASNVEAQVIASSMIRMAQTLCKEVVVEGVETTEQLTLLAKFGADRIQGYLISRPVPAHKLVEFVHTYEIARGAIRPELASADAGL